MFFSVILLFPNSFIVGLNYYPADETTDLNEINIYLFIIQLKLAWYEKNI